MLVEHSLLVTMASNKIVERSLFYSDKDGGNNNNKFGILFRTTVVSMTTKIIQ